MTPAQMITNIRWARDPKQTILCPRLMATKAHGHFVRAWAKRIEEHEFGAICYFERAPRGFLNGRSTLSKRTYQQM